MPFQLGAPRPLGASERYKIDLRPGSWGQLHWIAASGGLNRQVAGQHCFATLHGREQPCGKCPVPACTQVGGAKGVVRRSLEPLVLDLISAETRDSESAVVSVIPMDSGALSALIGARIDALCERASVTLRERAVLDRTLLGWSQKDIAQALAISVRTVKYHEANLHAKLGADSRLDLMRLFL